MNRTHASLSDFPALQAAVEAQVPDDHFFIRALQRRHGKTYLEWLDRRYALVFGGNRVEWQGNRLASIRRDLGDPNKFSNTDAEVQLVATVLSSSSGLVRANNEQSGVAGARTSDFLILSPREIDVEVRILQEDSSERERATISGSIRDRLQRLDRSGYAITLRVRKVRSPDDKLVLTPKIEKDLAAESGRILRRKPQGKESIVVRPDGTTEEWDGGSLHGVLVEIDVAPSVASGLVMEYGGLRASPGAKETIKALKKKVARKQRSGTRPWVIVLDFSGTPMMDFEEIEEGAAEIFDSTTSLSAVGVQRRQFGFAEILPGPNSAPTISIESRIFVNQRASIVLTDEEQRLFIASEVAHFPHRGATR